MHTVVIPESVDSSQKLQSIIDRTGNIPAKYMFSPDQHIEINSRLRVYNYTEFDGTGCQFTLMDNAPPSIFGEQIPLIAPKYPTSTEGLVFHDFKFDGRREYQAKVPKKNGKNWGLGYHNLFLLGSLSSVSYNNSKNCEFYNIDYKNSLGDLLRVEGGTNISAHDITASRGGHDVIMYVAQDSEVYNLKADMAVNAAVRTRSAKNIKIHDCVLNGGTGEAYSPAIQIQATAKNWISENIEIYNNEIYSTYGPGVQVAGNVTDTGLVHIHHNFFNGCGAMPGSVNRPVTGAITFDGFPVKIENNTIVNSLGFGIVAGDYDVGSKYSFEAEIAKNIVFGTRKAYKAGLASGTGIANLLGSRYSIDCRENCLYDNSNDLYKVTNINGIYEDPGFTENYYLQDSSSCKQAGRFPYESSIEDEKLTKLILTCAEEKVDALAKTLTNPYTIYRRS
ncbi:MAG: hypothetical protein PHG77_12270 [Proteiniphilum sp.]|nr:hypothetical protein [Proteiniphilum sp.]